MNQFLCVKVTWATANLFLGKRSIKNRETWQSLALNFLFWRINKEFPLWRMQELKFYKIDIWHTVIRCLSRSFTLDCTFNQWNVPSYKSSHYKVVLALMKRCQLSQLCGIVNYIPPTSRYKCHRFIAVFSLTLFDFSTWHGAWQKKSKLIPLVSVISVFSSKVYITHINYIQLSCSVCKVKYNCLNSMILGDKDIVLLRHLLRNHFPIYVHRRK